MEYKKIYNFKTKRFVSIYGKLGKNILKKYIEHIIGGSGAAPAICDVCKQGPCKCPSAEHIEWHEFEPQDIVFPNSAKNPTPSRHLEVTEVIVDHVPETTALLFGDKVRKYQEQSFEPKYKFKVNEPTYVIFAHGSYDTAEKMICKSEDAFKKFNIGTLVEEGVSLSCHVGSNHLSTVNRNLQTILEGRMNIYKKEPTQNPADENTFLFPNYILGNQSGDNFLATIVKITVNNSNPANLDIKYYKLNISKTGRLISFPGKKYPTGDLHVEYDKKVKFSEILDAIQKEEKGNRRVKKINICIASCLSVSGEYKQRKSGDTMSESYDKTELEVDVLSEMLDDMSFGERMEIDQNRQEAFKNIKETLKAAERRKSMEIDYSYRIVSVQCRPGQPIDNKLKSKMVSMCPLYPSPIPQFNIKQVIFLVFHTNEETGIELLVGYCFVKNNKPKEKTIHSICITSKTFGDDSSYSESGCFKFLINHIISDEHLNKHALYLNLEDSSIDNFTISPEMIDDLKIYNFRFTTNSEAVRPTYGDWTPGLKAKLKTIIDSNKTNGHLDQKFL